MLIWLTKVREQVGDNVTEDQMKEFVWNTLKSGQVWTQFEHLRIEKIHFSRLKMIYYQSDQSRIGQNWKMYLSWRMTDFDVCSVWDKWYFKSPVLQKELGLFLNNSDNYFYYTDTDQNILKVFWLTSWKQKQFFFLVKSALIICKFFYASKT